MKVIRKPIKTIVTLGQSAVSNVPENIQNVNVNIHGTDTGSVKYESVGSSEVQTRDIKIDDGTDITERLSGSEQRSCEAEKAVNDIIQSGASVDTLMSMLNMYREIITDDKLCLLNMVDQSGLIILTGEMLVTLISQLTGLSKEAVLVSYEEDVDDTCKCIMQKISPIKNIASIKIATESKLTDLKYTYNDIYNKLVNDFKISLSRVLVIDSLL